VPVTGNNRRDLVGSLGTIRPLGATIDQCVCAAQVALTDELNAILAMLGA